MSEVASYTLENLSDLMAEIQPDSITSRTFYRDERVKLVLFGFDAGQELSEHTSSYAAMLHILKGEAALTLGSDQYDVQAGTWVSMPPRLPHSLYAKSPVVMLLYMFQK